ncbi:winged helix-turn-helix transcriptional regulator [Hymenobacter sp. BRD67]|uniref:winged helix-turn-helix transcriptional regulator n=1 Tax=Hymenobacter sp. BRD67 TaxID=2675877 RepID=UPI001566FFFB|nr:helix-turn-helix domain-containing protein [Hymenobacter sp. BRD67]QKG54277.1 helix-turn-helix transcriptional regulator [Hymenobacter sp. BRD67]
MENPHYHCPRLRSRRFKELSREIEGVSAKMLSKELKDLETNGLITRLPHGSPTIAVTYVLAPLGKSLDKLLVELREWGAAFRASTAVAGYPKDTANLLVTK